MLLQTTCQTAHGQLLDLITTPVDKVDLTRYTIENYFSIVTFKTAYYSFYMPVACGLIVSGVNDPAAFELAKSILIPMGQYFQVFIHIQCSTENLSHLCWGISWKQRSYSGFISNSKLISESERN